MKNKKKIIKIILLIILLIVVSLISFMGGGSFSRYISEVEGLGVMNVAKWSFLANGESQTITNMSLFNSFDANTVESDKIAPGTYGAFNIVIDATGTEVGVVYEVDFQNETNLPQNMFFKYEGNDYHSLQEIESFLTGTIDANDVNKIRTFQIEWWWPIEYPGGNQEEINAHNIQDTYDGQNLDLYQFDVAIRGKQIDTSNYNS